MIILSGLQARTTVQHERVMTRMIEHTHTHTHTHTHIHTHTHASTHACTNSDSLYISVSLYLSGKESSKVQLMAARATLTVK